MNPSKVREVLLMQHERLRGLFGEALGLARRREAGGEVAGALEELLREVGRAFEEHNRYEESVLRPMFVAQDWGWARVERMLEEHAEEHRVMITQLAGEAARSADALADLVEEVEAHMAAEERVFLNVAVLRDPG